MEMAFKKTRVEDRLWLKGITDEEMNSMIAKEVVSSNNHVSPEIGFSGHFTINPSEGRGKEVQSSCHTKSINQKYSPSCFNFPRDGPSHVSILNDKNNFSLLCSIKAVEDLLIKVPGSSEYKIPLELLQFSEAIQIATDTFHRLCIDAKEKYYCYISCISLDTPTGSSQSFHTIHADGLLGSKHRNSETGLYDIEVPIFFSVCDALPTEFFPYSVDVSHLDPDRHDFSKWFNYTMDNSGQKSVKPKPYELVLWDGYSLHRSATNTSHKSIHRTFMRLEYSTRLYDAMESSYNTAFENIVSQRHSYGRQYLSSCGGWGMPVRSTKVEPNEKSSHVKEQKISKASRIKPINDNEESITDITKVTWKNISSWLPNAKLNDANKEKFPLKGTSVHCMRSFLKFLKDENYDLDGMTTAIFCENIIKPLTKKTALSFVDLVNATSWQDGLERPYIGKATVFISHAWNCNFLDVFLAMEAYAIANEINGNPVYLWFDTMTVAQHNTQVYDANAWSELFRYGVKEIGRTCMVLTPWESPIPLTRSWCLWELICTIHVGSTLSFQVVPSEVGKLEDALINDIGAVLSSLTMIDMTKAQARDTEDKKRIDDAVLEFEIGFTAINRMVAEHVRNWICECANRVISNLSQQQRKSSHSLLINVSQLFITVGKLEEAEVLLREVISSSTDPEQLVSSKLSLVKVLIFSKKFNEAATICKTVLLLYQHKSQSLDYFHTLKLQADILYETGQYSQAEKLYRQCISSSIDKETNPDYLDTQMKLATVLWKQKLPATLIESEKLFRQCIIDWESYRSTSGEQHNSMLFCYGAFATFLDQQRNHEQALHYCRLGLNGRWETLGSEHPLTLRSMHNMAGLLKKGTKDQEKEALELINRAVKGRQKVLGISKQDIKESIDMQKEIQSNISNHSRGSTNKTTNIKTKTKNTSSSNELVFNGKVRIAESIYQKANEVGDLLPWDIGTHQPYLEIVANIFFGNVLDIGCGYGDNAIYIARIPAIKKVSGIDIAPSAVTECFKRARIKANDLLESGKLSFSKGDALNLRNRFARYVKFDTILDSCVFHCFDHNTRLKYVMSLSPFIKVGGNLVLACISDLNPDPYTGPERLSKEYLTKIWIKAGFRIDSIQNVSCSSRKFILMVATKTK